VRSPPGLTVFLETIALRLSPRLICATRYRIEQPGALTSTRMADEAEQPAKAEPTQITPKGLEIRMPKYKDLMEAFRKIVHAPAKKQP
jgi:hypothetical protein